MKQIHIDAQKQVVGLLDGKVPEMEASIMVFKSAASSLGSADTGAFAVRVTGVESRLAALSARADAADAAATTAAAAAAAAFARDQALEMTLRELSARVGSTGGAPRAAPANGGQQGDGGDPMSGGNDAWSWCTANHRRAAADDDR